MTVSQIMEKMVTFSEGNIHDIDHFIRVWTYAKTIGELENLDDETLFILEVAAITHDIACPLCREKYGNTNGKHQEEEGVPLVKESCNLYSAIVRKTMTPMKTFMIRVCVFRGKEDDVRSSKETLCIYPSMC